MTNTTMQEQDSGLHVETHQHEVDHIGFTEDRSVVITFDNGPINGEVIIPPVTMEQLYTQWRAFCGQQQNCAALAATAKPAVEAVPDADRCPDCGRPKATEDNFHGRCMKGLAWDNSLSAEDAAKDCAAHTDHFREATKKVSPAVEAVPEVEKLDERLHDLQCHFEHSRDVEHSKSTIQWAHENAEALQQARALIRHQSETITRLSAQESGPSFQSVLNKICGDLPNGFYLDISCENGAAWVELQDWELGDVELPDSAGRSMLQQVDDALCAACPKGQAIDRALARAESADSGQRAQRLAMAAETYVRLDYPGGIAPDDDICKEGADLLEAIAAFKSDPNVATVQPAAQQNKLDWADLVAIAETPDVSEALINFSDDHTQDNACCIISAVLDAANRIDAAAIGQRKE